MRVLVAFVLLAVLAVGAWFVFDQADVAPSQALLAPANAENAAVGAATPAAAPAVNALSSPVLDASHELAATQRTAAAAAFAGPSAEVQVVHFDSKAPIAGAAVYCWPPGFDWKSVSPELLELQRTDQDAFLQRVSPTMVTDAEGRCRVPMQPYGAQVTAAKDDLWGQCHVPKDAKEPVVLVVRADCTLRVLVVDAVGKPARAATVMAKRLGKQPMDFGFGETDATGRLQRRHLQELAGEAASQLQLVAQIPGGEGPVVVVDATAPPPEVVLHLPAGGTVLVHVRDAQDKPIDPAFLGNPVVNLATWPSKPTDPNAHNEAMNRSRGSVAIDERGDAVFGTVAFGCHVMARADHSLHSVTVPGPTLEQPRIELTVRESADDVVLTGVLLDADGQPLASTGCMVSCHYGGGMSGQNGKTDGAGRFRVNLRSHVAGQQAVVSFDTKHHGQGDPLALELPARLLAKGHTDLGEVRLARHGVLVQGRVMGVVGAEPPRVQLQFERQQEGRWQQEWNLHPEWAVDGAFTLRSGIAKGTPMRLLVQSQSHLPIAPIEFAAGASGIEITLQSGGFARATFLVDATVPLEHLVFRFQRMEPAAKRDSGEDWRDMMNRYQPQAVPADGRISREWKGLQPGRYRLQALCAGVGEPLLAIEAVEITEGACADARLVDIDLRGRARAFEIRATAADGTPIVSSEAFVVIRSSGENWQGFNLGAGVVQLAAPAAVDLIVIAKGHQAALVNGVFAARTIALEVAAEATLVVNLPQPLPEDTVLKLKLTPKLDLPSKARLMLDTGRGMTASNFFVEEVTVDATGKVRVPVRYPGEYAISATVSVGNGGRMSLRDFEPRTITLPAVGEVVVRVGEKSLTRILEALRK